MVPQEDPNCHVLTINTVLGGEIHVNLISPVNRWEFQAGHVGGGQGSGAVPQVGASNELPESEELDALYDRFLIRRQVSQVSAAQLKNLARLAAGSLPSQDSLQAAASNGSGAAEPAAGLPDLTMPDFLCAPSPGDSATLVPPRACAGWHVFTRSDTHALHT